MTRTYRFERMQVVHHPREEVFAFFGDANNLQAITPNFLHFKILTPQPIVLRAGSVLDYQLRLCGMPVRWRTLIETWDAPSRFSDSQVRGPYRRWYHVHEFYEIPEGTLCVDLVEYEIPLGPLGTLARWLFVRRQLDAIFDYRHAAIERLLPPRETIAAALGEAPLKMPAALPDRDR